jgi:hypothetical protein
MVALVGVDLGIDDFHGVRPVGDGSRAPSTPANARYGLDGILSTLLDGNARAGIIASRRAMRAPAQINIGLSGGPRSVVC